MGIHLLAALFFLLSAKRFALFSDFNLIESLSIYGPTKFAKHLDFANDATLGERLAYLVMVKALASLGSLVISFLLSLKICFKRKISWINPSIVLLISFLVNASTILELPSVKNSINSFGDFFSSYGLNYAIFINGFLFISIGLVLFCSRRTNNFIFKNRPTRTANLG